MMRVGLGQDSHAFESGNPSKKLILAGVEFDDAPPLRGNSDADVVFHAITNAISGVSGVNILGKVSDEMCKKQGITDSKAYLIEAFKTLGRREIVHVSSSIECLRPRITHRLDEMKQSIASVLGITVNDVGITATTGEQLTAFGRGEGIQVFSIVTVLEND